MLRKLSSRCRSGSAPPLGTIEAALEEAFAQLVTLEAELQHRQKRGVSESNREVEAIVRDIEAVRAATEELRSLTSGGSPAGYGFVVPRSRKPPEKRR